MWSTLWAAYQSTVVSGVDGHVIALVVGSIVVVANISGDDADLLQL
jgi:hypothetical protein